MRYRDEADKDAGGDTAGQGQGAYAGQGLSKHGDRLAGIGEGNTPPHCDPQEIQTLAGPVDRLGDRALTTVYADCRATSKNIGGNSVLSSNERA